MNAAFRATLVAIALATAITPVHAQDYPNRPIHAVIGFAAGSGADHTKQKSATPKTETYVVVQVGDDIKVVTKTDLKTLQKRTDDEDKQNLKKYEDAKKEAKENKEKFDMPKPLPRKVKKLSMETFRSQRAAETWRENYELKKEESKTTKKATNNW